jgi:hypothetical protein
MGVADFNKLMEDLKMDERTRFVSTTAPNRSTFGDPCYTGSTDVFRIWKSTSSNLDRLAENELEVIGDEPNVITARWTNAKSMSLEAFEAKLKAAGLDAGNLMIGCAL